MKRILDILTTHFFQFKKNHQIELAIKFAEVRNGTYVVSQVVSREYLLILRNKLYPKACLDWENVTTGNIWKNLNTLFTVAHRDLYLIHI